MTELCSILAVLTESEELNEAHDHAHRALVHT